MPRLDNSDPDTLEWVAEISDEIPARHLAQMAYEDAVNGTWEPGIYGPLDVCQDCGADLFSDTGIGADVPHPSYEEWLGPGEPYKCCVCGAELTADDN